MSVNSTYHRLHLAAVHEQGKMGETFPACPGIERRLGLLIEEWGLVK